MAKTILNMVGLVAVVLMMGAATARADSLDGTTWKVKVSPDKETAGKGERNFYDTLVFTEGKLTATAGLPHDFAAAACKVEVKGDIKFFNCEQSSKKDTMSWGGEAKGRSISGEMTWTKDGTKLHFTFKGKQE